MGKTISVKLPDEDAERLEKISADRQESVSESVRNLIRSAGEKRGGDGEEMRPGPDTKLEEILTILRSIEASKPDQELSTGGGSDETKEACREDRKIVRKRAKREEGEDVNCGKASPPPVPLGGKRPHAAPQAGTPPSGCSPVLKRGGVSGRAGHAS